MKDTIQHQVSQILSQWSGEDDAEHRTPQQVAADIDRAYVEYLSSLPDETEKIRRGQHAQEKRVA